jgi:hypothetical protein
MTLYLRTSFTNAFLIILTNKKHRKELFFYIPK